MIQIHARHALAVAGAALAMMAGAAQAETYSFESPANVGYVYNPTTFAGATFNDKSGVSSRYNAFFSVTPPDGSQAAFIQSVTGAVGSISLAFTGLTAGNSYTASFYLATRDGYVVNPLAVAFEGSDLGIFTATGTDFSQFTTSAFTASGTSGALTFTGLASTTGDNDVNLDLVTLNGVSSGGVAAVPEPASWGMMIAGLGATGAAMRRRRPLLRTA